jgi:hypothetical protein
MNVVVIGVAHPYSLPYLKEYLDSLKNQTYNEFDLLLFGHNIQYNEIDNFIDNYKNFMNIEYVQLPRGVSIPKSRELMIKHVKKNYGYNICIFTDTDDIYKNNYVKAMVNELNTDKYKIAFCDIDIYFSSDKIISNYFSKCGIPEVINWKFIIDKNCLGFGNTAINFDIIDGDTDFPEKIIAVDWWFYTMLMLKGHNAKFIKSSYYIYRQYENNVAGLNTINEDKILTGLRTKMNHYRALSNYKPIFYNRYLEVKCTYEKFVLDNTFRKKYLETVINKFKNTNYLWWEYIIKINW